MAGANYAHCHLEPCLLPAGSTKVFYDADTDIPEGTVILHAECAAARLAAAREQGQQQAIADLGGPARDWDAYRRWCDDNGWWCCGPAELDSVRAYLEAQTAEVRDRD
jgi:hypothetical protein